MAEENVKVAVRLRPFNAREKDRKSELIISMNGSSTTIRDPKGEKDDKTFTFDHSYWSHDGFEVGDDGLLIKKEEQYASQEDVFNDIGQGVLDNAYNGFNSTLFAYGQTGSGKSFSMVGYGPNKGIVPQAFETLFKKIQTNEDPKIKYQVTFSMLEIYMEAVDDLLVSSKEKKKGGLKVRQNPKLGSFYVDGLSKAPVASYDEISALMDKGTQNRTVAATQMNATSSRAHTVVTLQFDQIITGDDGKKTTRQSTVNLVDLAGSERAGSTGATGDRLKEGAQINKSLSALGNVISALASGKKAPFRDSVLTKLLQNALGGNSKTIMIAALSPAGINYDETLSTLRYADRAKQIKNKATVNESATDKLIRQMREENARLKALLESGQVGAGESTAGMSDDQVAKMKKKMEAEIRAQLKESEAQASRMDEDEYEKRLAEMQAKFEQENSSRNAKEAKMTTTAHMKNINEDAALSGMVVHFFEPGNNLIGRKGGKGNIQPQIALSGLSIADRHATVVVPEDGGPCRIIQEDPGMSDKMLLNGEPLVGERELTHHDRLLIGTNHLYVFVDPKAKRVMEDSHFVGWTNAEDGEENTLQDVVLEVDWDIAQKEILAHKQKSQDASLPQAVQDDLRELAPMIDEVNAIAHELNRNRTFEFVSLSGPIVGLPVGVACAKIKMVNTDTQNEWMLSRDDFEARRDRMQEIYRKHKLKEEEDNADNDDDDDEDDDEEGEDDGTHIDPFYHEPGNVVVGTTDIPLDCLAYNLDFDDDQFIQDYTGRNQGILAASIVPCTPDGNIDTDLREDPDDALDKPLHFQLKIKSATFKNPKWLKQIVTYKHEHVGPDPVTTAEATDSEDGGVVWDYSTIVSIPKVSPQILEWIQESTLTLVIKSWQTDDRKRLARPRTAVGSAGIMSLIDQFREGDRSAANVVEAIEALLLGKPSVAPAHDAKESEVNTEDFENLKKKVQEKNGVIAELDGKFKKSQTNVEELKSKLEEANANLAQVKESKTNEIESAISEGASLESVKEALVKSESLRKEIECKLEAVLKERDEAQNALKQAQNEKSATSANTADEKEKKKSAVCAVM